MRSEQEIRELLAQELEIVTTAPSDADTSIDRGWVHALKWVLWPTE